MTPERRDLDAALQHLNDMVRTLANPDADFRPSELMIVQQALWNVLYGTQSHAQRLQEQILQSSRGLTLSTAEIDAKYQQLYEILAAPDTDDNVIYDKARAIIRIGSEILLIDLLLKFAHASIDRELFGKYHAALESVLSDNLTTDLLYEDQFEIFVIAAAILGHPYLLDMANARMIRAVANPVLTQLCSDLEQNGQGDLASKVRELITPIARSSTPVVEAATIMSEAIPATITTEQTVSSASPKDKIASPPSKPVASAAKTEIKVTKEYVSEFIASKEFAWEQLTPILTSLLSDKSLWGKKETEKEKEVLTALLKKILNKKDADILQSENVNLIFGFIEMLNLRYSITEPRVDALFKKYCAQCSAQIFKLLDADSDNAMLMATIQKMFATKYALAGFKVLFNSRDANGKTLIERVLNRCAADLDVLALFGNKLAAYISYVAEHKMSMQEADPNTHLLVLLLVDMAELHPDRKDLQAIVANKDFKTYPSRTPLLIHPLWREILKSSAAESGSAPLSATILNQLKRLKARVEKFNIDPNLRSVEGQTIFDEALQTKNPELLIFLLRNFKLQVTPEMLFAAIDLDWPGSEKVFAAMLDRYDAQPAALKQKLPGKVADSVALVQLPGYGTLLTAALKKLDKAKTAILLEHGCNVNIVYGNGVSMLQQLVLHNSSKFGASEQKEFTDFLGFVSTLLKGHKSAEMTVHLKKTFTHYPIIDSTVPSQKSFGHNLIEHIASMEAPSSKSTELFQQNQVQLLKLLLEYDPDFSSFTAEKRYVYEARNRIEITRDPIALHCAILSNNPAVARFIIGHLQDKKPALLEQMLEVKFSGGTAFELASKNTAPEWNELRELLKPRKPHELGKR